MAHMIGVQVPVCLHLLMATETAGAAQKGHSRVCQVVKVSLCKCFTSWDLHRHLGKIIPVMGVPPLARDVAQFSWGMGFTHVKGQSEEAQP